MSEDFPRAPGGFRAGSRIAGYLLEEQIGQGGMAVVFRAHDERLDRTVALKILAPSLADDEAFQQRFMRESRAAAAVDDPHIIPVFEAGEASGVLFIAMRYVRGGDARSLLTSTGPLPVGRVAEMMSQVASALDAAHARGLVHRDVKPANILLDASSGGGRPDHVYLSDFGLSKAALQSSGLTSTGTFLGTLDYVAPEQIEGKPVDGRADQYALACAAFELLTGMPPFARSEAMAVMYAQLSEQPPSLSARRRDLPGGVDAVFYRALAKAPADRYASCREFAEGLRAACGLRPYDSGPGVIPGPDHPATQVAWRGDRTKQTPAGPGGTQLASGEPAGTVIAGTGAGGGTAQPSGPGTVQAGGPGTAQAGGPGTSDSGPATQAVFPPRGTSPDLTSVQLRGPLDGYQGQRPRWRSPGMLAAALVIVVVLGAGGAYAALHGKGHSGGGGGGSHQVSGLTAPGCSQAAATASALSGAQTTYPVPNGKPFGVAVSPDSKYVLATTPTTLESFITAQGMTLAHRFSFPIPGQIPGRNPIAAGMTITPDGQDVLVAVDNGIDVLSLEAAETGTGTLSLGQLIVPGVSGFGRAINVAVTPNGQFAFVTLQFHGEVAVFNLGKALANGGFNPDSFVGAVPLGGQPVGLAVSSDGTRLYVTSFAAHDSSAQEGVLAMLNVAQLEVNPKQATITRVAAGCSPARIVLSPDNKTVWVTARDSDSLLGFSAQLLGSDPQAALIAKVHVGKSPIGLLLVNRGTKILVADADINHTGANNLAVVNVAKALAGQRGALIGYLPSGSTPHEITITPNQKFAIVSDAGSGVLQVVRLSTLP